MVAPTNINDRILCSSGRKGDSGLTRQALEIASAKLMEASAEMPAIEMNKTMHIMNISREIYGIFGQKVVFMQKFRRDLYYYLPLSSAF